MERLRILELLGIVRAIKEAAKLLVPQAFPDLNDPVALYRWCRAVLSACARAATITPTKIDDAIVAWLLTNPFVSEQAFGSYYQFFKVVIEAVMAGKPDTEAATLVAQAIPPRDLDRLIPADSPLAQGSPIETVMVIVRLVRLIIEIFGPQTQAPAR